MKDAGFSKSTFGGYNLFVSDNAIIIPETLKQDLNFYHLALLHLGSSRMYHSMSAVTWRGKQKDVEDYVKKFQVCALNKNNVPRHGKIPVSYPSTIPWEKVAIDLIGPFSQETDREGKPMYAVTIMDLATRWIEIAPIKDKTAATIAIVFDRWWLCRYPRPLYCVHDQGKEFTGAEFQELLKSNRIRNLNTTAKNPQANATLESVHQVINNALRSSGATEDDWFEHLQNIAFAIRTSYNRVLKSSPTELVFGREMVFQRKVDIDLKETLVRKF